MDDSAQRTRPVDGFDQIEQYRYRCHLVELVYSTTWVDVLVILVFPNVIRFPYFFKRPLFVNGNLNKQSCSCLNTPRTLDRRIQNDLDTVVSYLSSNYLYYWSLIGRFCVSPAIRIWCFIFKQTIRYRLCSREHVWALSVDRHESE